MRFTRDYYRVLGVPPDATASEIKRAFRRLARAYHPDVNNSPEAEARFKEINSAYQVLSDPATRAAYDRFWRVRPPRSDTPPRPPPPPRSPPPRPAWRPSPTSAMPPYWLGPIVLMVAQASISMQQSVYETLVQHADRGVGSWLQGVSGILETIVEAFLHILLSVLDGMG